MKAVANILKFIFITILTICIIAIGCIKIVSSTILDQTYITQKLEETDFYVETYELVKSNFENYIYQSGLDEIVLENICSEEKVKQDINIMLSNIYEGTNQKIETTEIADNLNANIDKLGIKTSKNEKAIQEFVKHICDSYTNTIIHTKYEDNINKVYVKITENLEKINKLILIVLIVDIIFIIAINNKKISKDIQHAGIALLASSMFELTACNIVKAKVNIAGIKIFNDTFSKAVVAIIQDIIGKIVSLGITTLIIAIILIIIYAIIEAFTQKKEDIETTDK